MIKYSIRYALLLNIVVCSVYFEDITVDAGLSFSGFSQGVCLFDYNNDGMDDILFTTRTGGAIHLYRNDGNMEFTDVSIQSNLSVSMEARAVIAADYDNDGDQDVFIGATDGISILFQNDGYGNFQDVTNLAGIIINDRVSGCSWLDYNQDGFLDLYVGLTYISNLLFKNNGDGTFIEIAQNIGATGPHSGCVIMGLGSIDYDRDGDQDIFITQDNYNGNILLRNGGNGAFFDVSWQSQTDLEVMGMGVAFGDINRDGFFDFYTTNLNENSLLLNSSSGVFTDISETSGTQDIIGSMGWGTFFFDANNDGWVDLYNNNETAYGGVYNSLMLNNGDLTFSMSGPECGAVIANNGYGSAYSDLDQDGDLDIVLVGSPSNIGSVHLLRNDSSANNWIVLRLRQDQKNLFGIGSAVEIYHNAAKQVSYVASGSSYCSQNTLDVHFGLSNESLVDSAIIHWPDGNIESFYSLHVNNINYLMRGDGYATLSVQKDNLYPKDFYIAGAYPNPFNGTSVIEIASANNIKSKVEIYNLFGQKVLSNEYKLFSGINQQIKLSLNGHPSGVYFLKVSADKKMDIIPITLLK